MMKNILLSTLVIFLLGNLCHFGLPWWALAPIAAATIWAFPQSGFSAFVSGLIAGALLWGINAYWLDAANGAVFSGKVGQLFQGVSGGKLLLVTTVMGALLGGFGALTGKWGKDLFQKPASKDYYQRRKRGGRYR